MKKNLIVLLAVATEASTPAHVGAPNPSPTDVKAAAAAPAQRADPGTSQADAAPVDRQGTGRTNAEVDVSLRRFDLDCRGRGRALHRSGYLIRRPNTQQWEASDRISVNLEAMQWCHRETCREVGRRRIVSADELWIVFQDEDGFDLRVRRWDGAFTLIRHASGDVDLETGSCRAEPFSGFPDHQVTTG